MEEEVIELYHATLKESAISMTASQEFICNEENANNEFLGRGAYFYRTRQEAIEWTFKMYRDEYGHYPTSYSQILKKYRIVVARVKYRKCEILDLDTRENIRLVGNFADKLSQKLNLEIDNEEYKPLAVILNYIEKKGWIDGIKLVERTFPFRVKIKNVIRNIGVINKKVICVKDTNIIEKMKIDKKITQKEYEDSKYYICGG